LTREETRERIMVKADELFRQFGFGKTTVADIAEELAMSPANIFNSFPPKRPLSRPVPTEIWWLSPKPCIGMWRHPVRHWIE
jgi:hypothetical protein